MANRSRVKSTGYNLTRVNLLVKGLGGEYVRKVTTWFSYQNLFDIENFRVLVPTICISEKGGIKFVYSKNFVLPHYVDAYGGMRKYKAVQGWKTKKVQKGKPFEFEVFDPINKTMVTYRAKIKDGNLLIFIKQKRYV